MKTSAEGDEESGGIKAGFETLGAQGRHDRHSDVTAVVIVMMTMMMILRRRRRRIMMMNV